MSMRAGRSLGTTPSVSSEDKQRKARSDMAKALSCDVNKTTRRVEQSNSVCKEGEEKEDDTGEERGVSRPPAFSNVVCFFATPAPPNTPPSPFPTPSLSFPCPDACMKVSCAGARGRWPALGGVVRGKTPRHLAVVSSLPFSPCSPVEGARSVRCISFLLAAVTHSVFSSLWLNQEFRQGHVVLGEGSRRSRQGVRGDKAMTGTRFSRPFLHRLWLLFSSCFHHFSSSVQVNGRRCLSRG